MWIDDSLVVDIKKLCQQEDYYVNSNIRSLSVDVVYLVTLFQPKVLQISLAYLRHLLSWTISLHNVFTRFRPSCAYETARTI